MLFRATDEVTRLSLSSTNILIYNKDPWTIVLKATTTSVEAFCCRLRADWAHYLWCIRKNRCRLQLCWNIDDPCASLGEESLNGIIWWFIPLGAPSKLSPFLAEGESIHFREGGRDAEEAKQQKNKLSIEKDWSLCTWRIRRMGRCGMSYSRPLPWLELRNDLFKWSYRHNWLRQFNLLHATW